MHLFLQNFTFACFGKNFRLDCFGLYKCHMPAETIAKESPMSFCFVLCSVYTVRLYFCTQYYLFFCFLLHSRTHTILLLSKKKLCLPVLTEKSDGNNKKACCLALCSGIFFFNLLLLNDAQQSHISQKIVGITDSNSTGVTVSTVASKKEALRQQHDLNQCSLYVLSGPVFPQVLHPPPETCMLD